MGVHDRYGKGDTKVYTSAVSDSQNDEDSIKNRVEEVRDDVVGGVWNELVTVG